MSYFFIYVLLLFIYLFNWISHGTAVFFFSHVFFHSFAILCYYVYIIFNRYSDQASKMSSQGIGPWRLWTISLILNTHAHLKIRVVRYVMCIEAMRSGIYFISRYQRESSSCKGSWISFQGFGGIFVSFPSHFICFLSSDNAPSVAMHLSLHTWSSKACSVDVRWQLIYYAAPW